VVGVGLVLETVKLYPWRLVGRLSPLVSSAAVTAGTVIMWYKIMLPARLSLLLALQHAPQSTHVKVEKESLELAS
jgi:hypothetical protein